MAYEFFFSIELIKRIYLEQRKVSKGGKFFFFFRYELNIFVSRFDESGIEKGDASKTLERNKFNRSTSFEFYDGHVTCKYARLSCTFVYLPVSHKFNASEICKSCVRVVFRNP